MYQIKNACSDMRKHVGFYGIMFVQLVICFTLFSYSLVSVIKLSDGLRQLHDLARESSFVLLETTSENQIAKIFDDEERAFEKLEGIFAYLEENNVRYMVNWRYEWGYEEDAPNRIPISEYTVNKEFLDLNNIQVCEGRMFEEEDYQISGNQVPVLVGKDLQEEYQLGQTFTYQDGDLGEECVAKVVGILNEHATRFNIGFFENETLNNAILKPFSVEMFLKGKNMASFDMALGGMVFITDAKTANQVAEYIEKTETFTFELETVDDMLKEISERHKPQMEFQIFILVLVFVFVVFGFVSWMLVMMEKNMVEYAIHIHCGASVEMIAFRMTEQVFLLSILAMIPSMLLYHFSRISMITCLLPVVLCLVMTIVVVRKLKNTNMVQTIRRYE